MITAPLMFTEAIQFLLGKEQLPAEWDASIWQQQEPDFQTKAFFSAKVENARFLDRAQGLIFDYLAKVEEDVVSPDMVPGVALKVSGREQFVKRMRDFMITEGMADFEEFKDVDQKDITDLRSLARLRLIFDTNVRQSYGYGQWAQGMTPAVRKAFPAARLIRDRGVKEARPRHQANLGEVLLKTDPRWADFHNAREIGGFSVAWGPYGFQSGVTQTDVSKSEARQLGLAVDNNPLPAKPAKITDGTEASTKKMDPDIKKKLLEELRGGPKAKDPARAGRDAAADVRRIMLQRGLADAEARGDTGKAGKYQKAIADLPDTAQGFKVIEDGDRIILNEGISQRLSKLGKTGEDSTPEQDLAIARKIFETVDRKSAEPQTRPDPQKGVARARQLFADELTLTPEERKILKSPHEILLVHDAAGRLKKSVLGTPSNVSIPDNINSGYMLSHNHPSGRGPSDSDIKAVLSRPGTALRIVAMNEAGNVEIFEMRSNESLPAAVIDAIADIYKNEAAKAGDSHAARRSALALIVEAFGDMISIKTAIL